MTLYIIAYVAGALVTWVLFTIVDALENDAKEAPATGIVLAIIWPFGIWIIAIVALLMAYESLPPLRLRRPDLPIRRMVRKWKEKRKESDG